MSRATSPQWSVKADAILADGQWHDGMELVREIEKYVTPGVALRHVEAIRAGARGREGKKADERKVARPERRLIAIGKRSLARAFLTSRLRRGSYVTDPSPMPKDGWRKGGWKIRDARLDRVAVRALEGRYHLSAATIRTLILTEPALAHVRGARSRLELESRELPQLEARIEEYHKLSPQRRGDHSREAHRRRREAPKTKLTLTDLAHRCGISVGTARQLQQTFPMLGWIRRGRNSYLPLEQVPDFEAIAEAYHKSRRRGVSQHALVPAFDDPELRRLWGRYIGGETELRDQVYAQMRRAYHEATDT